jgi:hypothetical protein
MDESVLKLLEMSPLIILLIVRPIYLIVSFVRNSLIYKETNFNEEEFWQARTRYYWTKRVD